MPRYRITRMQNERSATRFDFDATDDGEAMRLLHDEACLDARFENSGDADAIEPDVFDETRGLDRLEKQGPVMLIDELSLKSQMPYSREARDFTLKVAKLGEEGAYDDAVEALSDLIAEARRLCGLEDAGEEGG